MEDLTSNKKRHKLFRSDSRIWCIVILLVCISILAVYSSSSPMAYIKKNGDTSYYIIHHIGTMLIGIAALVIFYLIPTRTLKLIANVAMWGALILLGATMLLGIDENDATRRLMLFGTTFQTSDAAKVAVMLYLAKQLSTQRSRLDDKKTLQQICIPPFLAAALIFPANFSTAFLLGAAILTMLFIGQVRFVHILKITGILAALVAVFVSVSLMLHAVGFHASFVDKVTNRAETWVGRLARFGGKGDASDESDTSLTADYQAIQAELAVASGGLTGTGIGNSTLRYSLPHPYSDFIYAIIVEETGLAGGVLVLLIYLWFFSRVKKIVKRCDHTFPAYLAIGLGINILFQALMHMGVDVGVFPVTGQQLPFVSMGGSSLLFTGISFGIILRISCENEARIAKELAAETAAASSPAPEYSTNEPLNPYETYESNTF